MKGKLSKTERGWFVKYKMVDDLIATDGGIIPIHPDYEKYYFLNENDEDGEVEFEMVKEYIDERTNQIQTYAKLKQPPKLMYRDGTPIRSYRSPKIQELLDEINLEEISKEQLEKERNPKYKYFDTSSQAEISDEIFGQELFNYFSNQHNISLLQSEMHDIIDIVKKMEQTEISDAGKDTADYIDRHIIESMKELAREGFKPQVSEISDEEIEKAGNNPVNDGYSFIEGAKWYREQLKNRNQK